MGGLRVMQRSATLFAATLCWLAACESSRSEPSVPDAIESPPTSSETSSGASRSTAEFTAKTGTSRTFGGLRQPDGPVIPLAEIAADPARYDGRPIRTEGEIQRVCQKRGCWLELADTSGARAFVPMAGHAFVVPIDSIGSEALVEGVVHRRERSDAEREHLKADGAGDRIPALSIEANAVVIR